MSLNKPSKDAIALISNRVRERVLMSRSKMSKRSEQWARNEEEFAAYIPETAVDAERKLKRDEGKPQYTTIYVPYSYAIAMTAHTYYTSVFMGRDPIFQVTGRHGETEMQTQGMEALLDYQRLVGRMDVPLFLWLFDPIKYGHGFIGMYWDEETVQCRKRIKRPRTFLGVEIPGSEEVVETVSEIVGYAGNKLYNIRPQDALPDPRVSLWNFQAGEFFGRYVELTDSELLSGFASGKYFTIPKKSERYNYDVRDAGSSVVDLPGAGEWYTEGQEVPELLRAYEMYVKLIPRQWKLAPSDKLEIWVFYVTVGSYEVFGAVPLGEYHGQFPIDILEQEPDAYALFSRSLMEVMQPLNETITWLVNSHMFNVRSALNNMFAVDPSMVVMKDLENPAPGKLIRLKPAAYGRDIRTMISQFQVADVTQGHVPNMQLMAEMLQRVTGVNDNIMGLVNAGGRRTATEVRQSTTLGINRLKTTCEFFSMLGWAPMVQKMIQSTLQHYNMEQKFRVVGDLANFSQGFIDVTPDSIAGFYDFVPVDGSLPVDRFAQANLWQMMLGQVSKVPQIAAQYDLGKIFAWVASLAGLKNIQAFKVQLGDPGQLAHQAAMGNIVPLQASGKDFGRPPNQMQIPGMGATA